MPAMILPPKGFYFEFQLAPAPLDIAALFVKMFTELIWPALVDGAGEVLDFVEQTVEAVLGVVDKAFKALIRPFQKFLSKIATWIKGLAQNLPWACNTCHKIFRTMDKFKIFGKKILKREWRESIKSICNRCYNSLGHISHSKQPDPSKCVLHRSALASLCTHA